MTLCCMACGHCFRRELGGSGAPSCPACGSESVDDLPDGDGVLASGAGQKEGGA